LITLRGVTLRWKAAGAALGLLLVAGCGSSSDDDSPDQSVNLTGACLQTPASQTGGLAGGDVECIPQPTDPAGTAPSAQASGQSSGGASTTEPLATAAPLGPQEVEGECPYLTRQQASELEGNMVGRVTVVTTDPPGCNFYFAYGDGHMVLQISTQRFTDPIDAYNAMVTTANAGSNADPVEGIGDGAVLYQTGFYDLAAAQDWACAFVKGGLLVIVNTDQKSPSFNARAVAEAVAPLIS
jgi:hypothetical protein